MYQETPTPVSSMLCKAAPIITVQAITLPLLLHSKLLGSLPQLDTSLPCGRSVSCEDTDSTFLHALHIWTHMNFQTITLLLLPHDGVGHAVPMATLGQTSPLPAGTHALMCISVTASWLQGEMRLVSVPAKAQTPAPGIITSSWHRHQLSALLWRPPEAHHSAQQAGQRQPLDAHDAVAQHHQAPASHDLIEARRVQHAQAALLWHENLPEFLIHPPLRRPC